MGLQAFSPSAINKSGQGVVPLEVLIDLKCGTNFFDRLVPQTDATLQYDKFNRLRLRNNVNSVTRRSSDSYDQTSDHLESQNVSELWDRCPSRFWIEEQSQCLGSRSHSRTTIHRHGERPSLPSHLTHRY